MATRQPEAWTGDNFLGTTPPRKPARRALGSVVAEKGSVLRIAKPIGASSVAGLWRKLAAYRLAHYRLDDNNRSLGRALAILLTAHLKGLRTVLEIRADVEPYIESGFGVILKWLGLLADRTFVGSELKRSMLEKVGVCAESLIVPLSSAALHQRVVESVVPSILSIGPLERTSNHSAVIRAFHQVKQKYPRAELQIIGNGRIRDELKALADSFWLTSVTFTEYSDSVSRVKAMYQSDVYVDASCHEELSEQSRLAMATGLPIIKARFNGSETWVQDGVNGLLFPLNDQSVLADRILSLVEDPPLAQRLSEASAATSEIVSDQELNRFWNDIYKSIL